MYENYLFDDDGAGLALDSDSDGTQDRWEIERYGAVTVTDDPSDAQLGLGTIGASHWSFPQKDS